MNLIPTSNAKTLLRSLAIGLTISGGAAIAQSTNTSTQPQIEPRVVPQIDMLTPQRGGNVSGVTSISAVDVDVRVSDALASTHIEITVENHGSATTQARLVLPVPEGSVIRSFGIDGIGDEPTAQLLPREEASRRYNEIVRQMVDPGLLEFVGNALIQSSVFPVEPGASRVMTIEYEQTLDAHGGRVEYVFPRSAGYTDSSIEWQMQLTLESKGEMGPVFSPSHPIVSKIINDHSMRVSVPMLDEPGAFRLYAALGSGDVATTLLYPDSANSSSGYFMFVADVPQPDMVNVIRPREITIVIDRSGSMGGEKIEQARESARQIVHGMREGERVRIVDYADDVRSFSEESVEINEETVPELIAYIDRIESRGGTNLHDAIVDAMSAKADQVCLPMVLFLTDGLATIGVTGESEIRQSALDHNTFGRRVFTFGVGFDVNVPLLDGIAMDTRAESTFVLPGEDVEMKVGQVFEKLEGPVMTYPELVAYDNQGIAYHPTGVTQEHSHPRTIDTSFEIELRMMEPRILGDLYAGSRVVVLGRYEELDDGNATMMVQTTRSAVDFSVRFGARPIRSGFSRSDATVRHAFIERLWAQNRIDSLINDIRLASVDGSEPDAELVDEIVRLSLEHGIMSEYTSFLAAEEFGLEVARQRDENGDFLGVRETQRVMSTQTSVRSGRGAVAQSANRKNADAEQVRREIDAGGGQSPFSGGDVQSLAAPKANKYYDDQMNSIAIQTIQRGHGATMFKKTGRWVDAQLGEHAGEDPEITIAFGEDAYWDLIDDLVDQGRQWILANRGEVYFMNHSKRVLVRNPE